MDQVKYIYGEIIKSLFSLVENRKSGLCISRAILPVIFIAVGMLYSCGSTKYVPKDKYLLDKYQIKSGNSKLDEEELATYIKQKPNKKILGLKFHLSVYNLSREDKDNWWNRSLRTIGEEPVILDVYQTEKTASQLNLFLKNKGYYDAVVTDTILYKKKKARVTYNLVLNQPYKISSIQYKFEDENLAQYILPDTLNCLLKRNNNFDVDVLSAERERLEKLLKNRGFYNFSKEYIFYLADSTRQSHRVDVTLGIKKFRQYSVDGSYEDIPHPKYEISSVSIFTNYDPRQAIINNSEYLDKIDTLVRDSISIIFNQKLNVKPGVVLSSDFVLPGELYNLNNVNQTYRNLSSLQLFRQVSIDFTEPVNQNDNSLRQLDCNIQLSPFVLQSYNIELEGTNSSGNIGGGGNIGYQHRNLFHGAENFDFRIKGAIESLKETSTGSYGNMVELGAEASLNIPKFLLPFRTEQFIKKFNPKTTLKLAYNFQKRPDYTRTVANASFGYIWKGNKYVTHIVNPIELNLVKIPYKSQEFIDWLQGTYIFYSYQPHLVSVTSYSMTFTNQNLQKTQDFVYLKLNAESAGNILYSIYSTSGAEKVGGAYELFNTSFAQYIRGDIDYRFYNVLDKNNSIVYRFFAGAGLPYNNSTALPFEKKYFSGGANSIRAWQVRSLGPGSYKETVKGTYANQTADIKLEANLEYRFKLFWLLEGALFVDAGNIWAINKNDDRAGALFEWNQFYKDIAVGTGFGARFDFSFFIFRFDLGIKTRDPVYESGQKWVFGNRKLGRGDFVLNLGIGYPF
ncbi:MAG: BamA/TamA family outer membrane protein [Bacteroidales bacterium]|nr:BamA/TamA family outer membrane protein [Bacteroidales bacterium]MCB9000256.1 BamA/TamA family outer membrane protein [Bacteroidales bacterium]MCB9013790.1 BamA/TamA family outer membrane protein [Bacteroidales bacterium]